MGLAYISLRDGSNDEALHLCGQALESNPENLYARVLRARVFFEKENTDQALGELIKPCGLLRGQTGRSQRRTPCSGGSRTFKASPTRL